MKVSVFLPLLFLASSTAASTEGHLGLLEGDKMVGIGPPGFQVVRCSPPMFCCPVELRCCQYRNCCVQGLRRRVVIHQQWLC